QATGNAAGGAEPRFANVSPSRAVGPRLWSGGTRCRVVERRAMCPGASRQRRSDAEKRRTCRSPFRVVGETISRSRRRGCRCCAATATSHVAPSERAAECVASSTTNNAGEKNDRTSPLHQGSLGGGDHGNRLGNPRWPE